MTVRWPLLTAFVGGVVCAGLALGFFNIPGAWYAQLAKPSFNPPNAVFAPVWTVLYILVGIAGYRAWIRQRMSAAMNIWFLQLALNLVWSPVFFSLHWIGGALAIILALFVSILAFIALQWPRDRLAASLFIPYAAWVAFASLLNFSIYRLN
jgi:tryptophan-rich sensory protein